jgi:hypothetical protein
MAKNDELVIPAVATKDPGSFELLRVWIANKGQHVSLRTGVWKDPAAWGVMLSDLMQHIANSYQQQEGLDRVKTLQRIKAGLDAELTFPTDQPSGGVQ